MTEYIELNRQFADFDAETTGESEYSSAGLARLFGKAKTWADVLKNRCTVIISEAGTGKTEELRHRARCLQQEGNAAFFCRLDLLVDSSFQGCMEVGTLAEFEAWRTGDAQGYFFLDSVDEARLTSPKDFEIAVLAFVAAIEPQNARATIVISTRLAAWQMIADPEMLATRLGVALPEKSMKPLDEGTGEDVTDLGDAIAVESTVATPSAAPPRLSILTMGELSSEQVRTFAAARGVADVDKFLDALERTNADLFAGRPADLDGLIRLWNVHGRIGRYKTVVESNIATKLRETNSSHQHRTIDERKAFEGAQRLAAAVTFTGRSSIRLPQTPHDAALDKVSIDAMAVLEGWPPEDVRALLSRALFDESLYGTVRFHHRTAREYLAAKWLGRMLDQRKGRRAVQTLLFGRPYGVLPEAVIPSMAPVTGWLALEDEQVRDKVNAIDPKILLEHGDASSLDSSTRAHLLNKFAERYAGRQHTPLSLNVREVRLLADQALSSTISRMLVTYQGHEDVRHLLLRIVREGRIEGCGDAILPLLTEQDLDVYTHSCAVQAIGVSGTLEQRNILKAAILSAPATFDRQVLAAAIETLTDLSCEQVASIVEAAAAPKPFSGDQLQLQLETFSRRQTLANKKIFLEFLIKLLELPPLEDPSYCRISRRYAWLVPLAFELATQITAAEPAQFESSVLTALSLAEHSEHMAGYHGELRKELGELLASSRSLNHALFWHEAEGERKRSGKSNKDFWHRGINVYHRNDVPLLIEALQTRPLDDKFIALSALVTIYGRAGQPKDLLSQLQSCIAGNALLEAALANHLKPVKKSAQLVALEKRQKEFEKKTRKEKIKNDQDRMRWITKLKSNHANVGDLSTAAGGVIWNNIYWLFSEMRASKGSNSRWTIDNWESLVPEFGNEVAASLRDYCVAFWRLYDPQVHSETAGGTLQTPFAVTVGLSGLAMEFRQNPSLATTLSDAEVKRATKYALVEMNEMPPWLWRLYESRPQQVSDVLVAEIEWELATPRAKETPGYVLARLRWGSSAFGIALRTRLVTLVLAAPEVNPQALMEALTVILRVPEPVPPQLITHALNCADLAATDELKALWLGFQLCVDADHAIAGLEKWVGQGATSQCREGRMTRVLNTVWGERFDGFNSPHNGYKHVDTLYRLLTLAYAQVRIEDDLVHDSGYSPGPRDHAQDARGKLLELLYAIPGKPTYDALLALSSAHTLQFPKDRMLTLAEQRAALDLEQPAWQDTDVETFAVLADRIPTNQQMLFNLASSRLDDLKLEMEEGDESEASLLRKVEDEYELRRAIANRLRTNARQLYTTGSEEELADKTRTDIRLHNPNVKERIPIELKIAGRWNAAKLRERLENQLVGQYMLEAKYGIFLVVNRETGKDYKSWTIGGKREKFAELIAWLQDEAKLLTAAKPAVTCIEVMGIDLTVRRHPAVVAVRAKNKVTTGAPTSPRKSPRKGRRKPKGDGLAL